MVCRHMALHSNRDLKWKNGTILSVTIVLGEFTSLIMVPTSRQDCKSVPCYLRRIIFNKCIYGTYKHKNNGIDVLRIRECGNHDLVHLMSSGQVWHIPPTQHGNLVCLRHVIPSHVRTVWVHAKKHYIWGLCRQKQVSLAGIRKYIPQFNVGCNYLSLPEIHASGDKVLILGMYLLTPVEAILFLPSK